MRPRSLAAFVRPWRLIALLPASNRKPLSLEKKGNLEIGCPLCISRNVFQLHVVDGFSEHVRRMPQCLLFVVAQVEVQHFLDAASTDDGRQTQAEIADPVVIRY